MQEEIRRHEERLRQAMLAGDVDELDRLLDDALLFVGPDTRVYGKADDLALHRTRTTRFTCLEVRDLRLAVHGDVAVVTTAADLAGEYAGAPFAGRYRYLRTWVKRPGGWRVVGGSVCAEMPGAGPR